MSTRVSGILFFISWLVCGCCIESMLDDGRVFIIALGALIVSFVCGLRFVREGLME